MEALKNASETHPELALLALLALAFTIALAITGFLFRAIRAMGIARKYDAAYEQIRAIEDKLMELRSHSDQRLAEAKADYEKQYFELQQVIFARNSEILDLKHQLLQGK
jgi:HAMP domain-containing protein